MPGIVPPTSRLDPTGGPQLITLTPELATQLLERNQMNRPLKDRHVARIAKQIKEGKWKFNGDTIKLSDDEDVLDGQHRLWAVIEAKTPVQTLIVYGIAKDAFATIDTIRAQRTGSDIVALSGTTRHRQYIAGALTWMLRWQRGIMTTYLAPVNKIENSDVEAAFKAHPMIAAAVDETIRLRTMCNPGIMGFLYYVITNRNAGLAERMLMTLANPAGVSVDDPFYRLRVHMVTENWRKKEPVMTIALSIKAANVAFRGKDLRALTWRNQGSSAESFPTLEVDPPVVRRAS